MAVDEEPPELFAGGISKAECHVHLWPRRETGENVGHVKFCCNSASEVEDMKHSRLVGLFVTLLGVLALFSSLNKPGVAALRGSEVLGLIGSGGCFGVGFVGLIGKLRVRD